MFTTRLKNFLPLSSNLKLSSANSFSLEESKICCLGKGQSHTAIDSFTKPYSLLMTWERFFFLQHCRKIVRCWLSAFSSISTSLLATNFNLLSNKPWFLHVCKTRFLKTLSEKKKLLIVSNFSFSNSVLYPFGELSAISSNSKCCLQTLSFWKGLKFVVW